VVKEKGVRKKGVRKKGVREKRVREKGVREKRLKEKGVSKEGVRACHGLHARRGGRGRPRARRRCRAAQWEGGVSGGSASWARVGGEGEWRHPKLQQTKTPGALGMRLGRGNGHKMPCDVRGEGAAGSAAGWEEWRYVALPS
jgi:hypothetical protein